MPKLYNYGGKRFDIIDVMGVFERDSEDNLVFLQSEDAQGKSINIDMGGAMVNKMGYIINEQGDICSR